MQNRKMFDCWNKNGNGPSFSNLIKNTDVFCRKTKNDENQEITELRIFSLAFKDNHYLPKAFVEHHMINAASIVLNSKKDWPDTLIQAGFHFSAKHVVTKDQESGIHRIMIISTMKIYSFYWEMNFLANYNCFRLNFIQSLSQPDAFKLQKWKLEEKVKM